MPVLTLLRIIGMHKRTTMTKFMLMEDMDHRFCFAILSSNKSNTRSIHSSEKAVNGGVPLISWIRFRLSPVERAAAGKGFDVTPHASPLPTSSLHISVAPFFRAWMFVRRVASGRHGPSWAATKPQHVTGSGTPKNSKSSFKAIPSFVHAYSVAHTVSHLISDNRSG